MLYYPTNDLTCNTDIRTFENGSSFQNRMRVTPNPNQAASGVNLKYIDIDR